MSLCVSKWLIVIIKLSALWTKSVPLFMKGFIKGFSFYPGQDFILTSLPAKRKQSPECLLGPFFTFSNVPLKQTPVTINRAETNVNLDDAEPHLMLAMTI